MKQETPKQLAHNASCWQLWLDGKEDLLTVWDILPQQVSKEGRFQFNNQRHAMQRYGDYFFGATEQDARQIIGKGWPTGAKIVETLAKEIQEELPPPKSRRRTRKWSQDGDEISYERLQLGQDPWLSSHRQLRSSCGLVEVVSSWGLSCDATLDQLKWSGAAALALTDLLEKADYSVELALVTGMRGPDGAAMVRIDLKHMGQLIDLEQLAAIACYPPAYRIYGLAAFQLGPISSGPSYNNHPHCDPFRFEPNGMWAYRPNVMTLKLGACATEGQAKLVVIDALKELDSMVNPQEA